MEFHEKLQELRKQCGLTQEAVAESLFVSRAAISKWESGRGYPNIDSLKAISRFYGITVDELLSGNKLLRIAEEDSKEKQAHNRDLVFGLLDCGAALYFFLPLFGESAGGIVSALSLLSLTETPVYLKGAYIAAVTGIVLWGIATLALQNCQKNFWLRHREKISFALSAVGEVLFIISSQPYAAVFLFVFLAVKVLISRKWR